MTLWVIEIDDTALSVSRDAQTLELSPGVALSGAHGVLTGEAARRRRYLEPRAAHDRFWQQLNELPLGEASRHCRHHADLAWRHLHDVLERAGRPPRAVLAVPAHYTTENLALLLGIAGALELEVEGLVDVGVAAVAGCAAPGRYTVARLYQHHATVVSIDVADEAVRVATRVVEPAALSRVYTACVDLIADAFLDQARFDPLHEAATEQLLYDRLPGWLAGASAAAEIGISVDYAGTRFGARVPARELERVSAMVLAPLREQVPRDRTLLLGAECAALPGAAQLFAPAHVLPAGAVARGIAEHHGALAPAGAGVGFVTRLPATRTPLLEDHSIAVAAGTPSVTHVLAGACAHALEATPLALHADGTLSRGHRPATALLNRQGAHAVLEANGARVTVDGVQVSDTRRLAAGDAVVLDDGRARFTLIHVR